MTTLALIKEAILALKERTGSSTSAINKYLLGEKQVRRFLQKLYRFFHRSNSLPKGVFSAVTSPNRQNYDVHNFVVTRLLIVILPVNDTSSSKLQYDTRNVHRFMSDPKLHYFQTLHVQLHVNV